MAPSHSDSSSSTAQRALRALKDLQAKLDAVERARQEPIAIVGTSCRFPGGVETPEAFWTLLERKTDAIGEIPSDRWPVDAFYNADPDRPGTMVSRYGGFVPHLYDFDAPFFRLSPREARALDPQQRLLLELGWEALERGGIAPDAIAGESAGTFVGIGSIDYWQRLLARHPDTLDAYSTTGNTHSLAAGRLSFSLDVTGPSMAVDAACASALVAIHLACQSLRQRDCNLAFAGAVNRILTPEASIIFSKAHMLSADGRCRTFDASASGFGRAEGGGLLVLKRLQDARAAGDRIQALILGSAVNHNGRTGGLTVPNGPAQQAVVRQALAASGLDPAAVGYVETHGTGTALGDPIEVGALGQVFGPERDRPLVLGATKTNVGHLEAAAGMAGAIKAALVLQWGQIPANLHLAVPNPHIDWEALPLSLPAETVPWPTSDRPRIAGVSAFGFSGTNAHILLQAAPADARPPAAAVPPFLLPLSARTLPALRQLVARYAQYLAQGPTPNLADFCYTASVGRQHFSQRLAILFSAAGELRQCLIDVLADRPNAACWRSDAPKTPTVDSGTSSLEGVAWRYVRGESIDWKELYREENYRKVALPTYPFQRQYYGID